MDSRDVRNASGLRGVNVLKPSSATPDSQSTRDSHGASGGYMRRALCAMTEAKA